MVQISKSGLSPGDPSSFSRPEEAKVVDIHLKLDVDFQRQVIEGSVTLTVEKQLDGIDHVILDSKDLTIKKVTDHSTGNSLEYTLGDVTSTFGSPLTIKLPNSNNTKVTVAYTTSSKSSALQWLPPEQTAGKKYPYLFSQCQAIHCRALVPCQDTPSVKAPYSAEISAPEDLVVLLSAVRSAEPASISGNKKLYSFKQVVPIPSYLIAIAVGALESRQIGPRSKVWSEKEYVDKAKHEFSETESMLKTAESLCGEYVWGIYDILVLPPSFPFGGMENPCLTFVTPTLLAGDRSLADVVAHEISHSWTGNLVTNANFEHFWLNEGFTVFFERKIMGRLKGEDYRQFLAIGGWKELADTINTLGATNPLTNLSPDLKNLVDPDDAFSSVPYEKGHTFLYFLEEIVGGPAMFEPFLKSYLEKFKYKSLKTMDFKAYLLEYFKIKGIDDKLEAIDWDSWLHTPGMPPYKPNYDDSLVKECSALCDRWVSWDTNTPSPFNASDIATMSSMQVREFLATVLERSPFSPKKLVAMEKAYNFNAVTNSEIRFRWLRLGIQCHWEEHIARALQFVTEQGRMKFVRPIYRDLYDWEEARPKAISNFEQHKSEMMYVTAYTVSKDLHLTI